MKIGEAEKRLKEGLKGIYEESERSSISRLVLEACTGYNPSQLVLQKTEELSTTREEKLTEMLRRLQQHEPVQYVLNKAWFFGLELYVDKNVLIPRPETEELVDWIIKQVKTSGLNVFQRGLTGADVTSQLKILDIGTGSGCIALALKKAMPRAEVWGCDVSEEALNVARRNGAALDIRVDFQGINFLDKIQQKFLPSVDIIVSNPPYIPLKDKDTMERNVLDWEPHTALFVPTDDALLFYKAIIGFAEKRLHQNGSIYLEIHEDLGNAVAGLFRSAGYEQVDIKKDMQGKERMVKVAAHPAPPSGRGGV
jgi:release factor glutamine methyltransferase